MIRCHSSNGSCQTRYLLEHYTGAPTSLPVAHSLTCHQRESEGISACHARSTTRAHSHVRCTSKQAAQSLSRDMHTNSDWMLTQSSCGVHGREHTHLHPTTHICTVSHPFVSFVPFRDLIALEIAHPTMECVTTFRFVCALRVKPVTTSQPPAPAQPLQAPNQGTRLLPVPLAYPCVGPQHRALAHVWPGVTRPSLGQRGSRTL